MSQHTEMNTLNMKNRSLVGLWAVGECGIGGILHAMKIPLTGIVVGGIAAMCLYFIALRSEKKGKAILEATSTVLLIKLIASPHSPWQAYVAVIFQAAMAMVFLTGKTIHPVQVLAFTLLTQIESAVQRILITVLIFGNKFIASLDKMMSSMLASIGLEYSQSVVWQAFGVYVILHVVMGIGLGLWLPKMEGELSKIQPHLASLQSSPYPKKRRSRIYSIMVIGLIVPILLAWYFQDYTLLYIFLRVMAITLFFLFVLSPLLKYLLKTYLEKSQSSIHAQEILQQLPALLSHYSRYARWAWHNYTGLKKAKYLFIALLYATTVDIDTHE